ncbi:MAG: phage terminase large subunit [Trueperaceae bacterium]|nr:phage terminase large subunit [Trueperaceae bacterium]
MTLAPATFEIRPQRGPQEQFLASSADIVIGGGAAGSGKSYALLMEPLRHLTTVKGFGAVTFRRTAVQVRNEGGLWDTSEELYGPLGLKPKESVLEWEHPATGNTHKFAHLEHEKNILDWQGSQVPLIQFDELTHFTAKQFWYMLSRNRSTCGVRPYIRATTNPDADSWVADLIAWWVDQDPNSPTFGLPIPERSGVLRWFVRVGGELQWAASAHELRDRHPGSEPKSLTFIAATLDDNPALTGKDPGYRANLLALDPVEQARLLHGNWKARRSAGTMFQRSWVPILDAAPALVREVRAWDLAATRPTPDNPDPDWTVGLKGGITSDGQIAITDLVKARENPGEIERLFVATATADGKGVAQRIPEDPGQAGKSQSRTYIKLVPGHTVRAERVTGDKVTRFGPASARAYKGLISVTRAPWNDWLFSQLEAFPDPKAHDDAVDALSDLVDELTSPVRADLAKLRRAAGITEGR